jgi:hypothetical protein
LNEPIFHGLASCFKNLDLLLELTNLPIFLLFYVPHLLLVFFVTLIQHAWNADSAVFVATLPPGTIRPLDEIKGISCQLELL